MDKRANEGYYMPPKVSNWISNRPMKSFNSAKNDEIDYLLQFLEKRSGELNEELAGDKSIRSPLGVSLS